MSLSAMRGLCLGAVLAVLAFSSSMTRAAPPPLEVYAALPKTEAVRLSPDGTMLAVVGTEGENRILSISKIGGGVISKVAIGEYPLSNLEWAGDDYVILFIEDEGIRAASVNVKDGSLLALPKKQNRIYGGYGITSEGGQWYVYLGLSSGMGYRYADLYKIDLATGTPGLAARGNNFQRSWALDTKGQMVAESDYDPTAGNWRVFRSDEGSKPLITGNSPFNFGLEGLSRTPGTVLVRLGGENDDTVELHLDSGRVENFLPPGKATEFIYSRSTRLLLGAVLTDDNQTLIFDPTLERHYKSISKAFAGHKTWISSVSDDLSRIILHESGEDTAGTWQLVDFKEGKSTPIAEDYPDIPDAMIGKVSTIDYRAVDGLSMQGILTLPPGSSPHNLPLIVLPHDGPANNRASIGFYWFTQALASRGYAVFQPNFRGSAGYGVAFRNAGFGQLGRKMQTDLSDGVAALAAQGIVDPRRVCVVGNSRYGGYAALAGVTLQHGIYRCAASYEGLSDLHDLLKSEKEFDGIDTHKYGAPSMRMTLSLLGVKSADDDGLELISPKSQAKSADAPILLIYGERDSNYMRHQSADMASALKSADKPVELMELAGIDGKGRSWPQIRAEMLKAIIAFVEKYNPPDPPATH